MNVLARVSSRPFANVFDVRVEGPASYHQCLPGKEYVDGFGGVAWYEYFRDSSTGETYRVECFDTVNGKKDCYSVEDQGWLNRCCGRIVARCIEQADSGATEVRVSQREMLVMSKFSHQEWLESAPEMYDGIRSEAGIEGGLVGHCHGVPVICDLSLEDNLTVLKLV